ncbi:hypothetical protein [Ornithinimicrobium sufpigmenti]|uniref:hypothetical protein n=1 Tax=Ornithinimicrobium sufpigmenti TaxID=2508882 RepID=UPI001035B6A9|nr:MULTISPECIES: hypothetical protein [unclassified Ornithinimicrobium]
MENAIVTGIGTSVHGSTLPTTLPALSASRLRASGVIAGSLGGSVRLGAPFGHLVPTPQPIFDPTQDETPVRIT